MQMIRICVPRSTTARMKALSLDYILTIAISAFFVRHYLGAFWPALTHPPGDVIGGLIVIALLAWLNVRGIGESAKLNVLQVSANSASASMNTTGVSPSAYAATRPSA
jgi:amino acid transporter